MTEIGIHGIINTLETRKNKRIVENNMSNKEAEKTEQLIQFYKEDTAGENLQALIHQMKKTIFLIPAMLPDTPEINEIKQKVKDNPGVKINLPKGTAPMPAILTNQNGGKFFPIYSTKEQIPKEPKFDLLMNMPFGACCSFAMDERLEVEGIALNPFTDNLLFKKPMLEAIKKADEEAKKSVKQIQMTPKQFQIMMRQRAELHDFPARAFQEGVEFVQRLSDEKEAVVNEIYQNAYQNHELNPYEESNFSVMALNISEELLLVRVDLPPINESAQLCYRVYVTLNPKTEEIHYFTIERGRGKDERNLCGVNKEGKHIEYGEAPVEGVEIQRIIDIIEGEKEAEN